MDILKVIGLKVDEPKETERDDIDLEIGRLTEKLKVEDPLSENYPKLTARLEGLYDIKNKKLDVEVPEPIFFQKYGETLLKCGCSILSTVLVLHYEDIVGPVHSVLKNKLGRD